VLTVPRLPSSAAPISSADCSGGRLIINQPKIRPAMRGRPVASKNSP
jgi:hypothetical protein